MMPDGGHAGTGQPDHNPSSGPVHDPLAASPPLTVPGGAPALADAVLNATTFADSYERTLDVLAEGGVTTGFKDVVKRTAKAPASTTFVFPVSAIDLALEAADRETMATFTLAEFAQMVHELGWPTPAGVSPGRHWVELLAKWYAGAAASPEKPDSFAVLFIAAMNQKQLPPANISTGAEDPASIRLSALELELLIAAFDRTRPVMATLEPDDDLLRDGPSPCSDALSQAGTLGQSGAVQVTAGELGGLAIGAALEMTFGEVTGALLGNVYSALGTASKVGKFIQQLRYGYVKLDLTTPSLVKKPLKGAANKVGELRATAGVDPAKYAEKVAARGGAEASVQNQALTDCFNTLGLPTVTDARDIAADAQNWRMEWSIVRGGDSQVRWQQGMTWDITNGGFQTKVMRVDETTVERKVSFDIRPQPTKATVGRERQREAVFKVQLHRGGLPELGTLWGSGKVGYVASKVNPVGVALGVADAMVDLTTKWILEAASPSAFARQELIEIEPTGLVGTISWNIQGTAPPRDERDPLEHEIERASIEQSGVLEIVSEVGEEATAFGAETCKQSYTWGLEREELVEGSEVVGTRTSQYARLYQDTWQTPPTSDSLALVVDGSTAFAGVDPSLLPAELRDMANKVTIYLSPSLGCGPKMGRLDEASIEYEYKNGAWQETQSYVPSTVSILPSLLSPMMLELRREPGSKVLVGQSVTMSDRMLYGVTVPLVQTLRWDLRWVE
jgi:hypothetical protein